MKKIYKGVVRAKIIADNWIHKPVVLAVTDSDGNELCGAIREKAIKYALYPHGGIDFSMWKEGTVDDFHFYFQA